MSTARVRVEVTVSARRGVNRMPEKAAAAVVEFCFGPLADNPYRVGRPLTRDLAGYHSARRGGYRVIYRIDEAANRVYAVRIEHRSDVYRRR
ncbi:MAG: type II toxin-antitoxin system RelE/ParE family toxin [Intrasporangium sp.]|uniref:type II toxin-antitoxin system RelE family toxin n=1 Tax=Intrasporangium sp. TaxID=1925024 RepID=UPI00264902B3|nr:type II toxin-antitoxin system RelE/ParE family toxin [Intrasporangium sp.]MDN5798316.1 type II toxin-antitoxin system RelE/ParE family toxin [Intrasporangium sp.]